MKPLKNPLIILDIDQTIFNIPLFKEKLTDTHALDESEYIGLLYMTDKRFIQELVMERNIQVNIFSTRRELLRNKHNLHDTTDAKRLKDYLEDYQDYQIYLVCDQSELLRDTKKFNQNIVTIFLQAKTIPIHDVKATTEGDYVINKLEDILPIITTTTKETN